VKSLLKRLVVAALALGAVAYAGAWSGPTQPPPGGNAAAPVNVSASAQSKQGTLGVGGLGVFGRAFVAAAGGYALPGNLALGVAGNVGADAYCDRSGLNCVATLGGGGAPAAAGGTAAAAGTCRAGYAKVGDYCIGSSNRPAVDFYDAASACADDGASLCTWGEWAVACRKGALPDVRFGAAGSYEWIDDYGAAAYMTIADPIVYGNCEYLSRAAPSDEYRFRCCYGG
jgi:hypothetical protein